MPAVASARANQTMMATTVMAVLMATLAFLIANVSGERICLVIFTTKHVNMICYYGICCIILYNIIIPILFFPACACDRRGSVDDYCDPFSGECRCRSNFGGRDCGLCLPGYYNYPGCDCKCTLIVPVTVTYRY